MSKKIIKIILAACCFSGAVISALIAVIAMVLKMNGIVTEVDGWIFWSIGMGFWFVLVVLGCVIMMTRRS